MNLPDLKAELTRLAGLLWDKKVTCVAYSPATQLTLIRGGGTPASDAKTAIDAINTECGTIASDIAALTDTTLLDSLDLTDSHAEMLTHVLSKCSNCTTSNQKEILLAAVVQIKNKE